MENIICTFPGLRGDEGRRSKAIESGISSDTATHPANCPEASCDKTSGRYAQDISLLEDNRCSHDGNLIESSLIQHMTVGDSDADMKCRRKLPNDLEPDFELTDYRYKNLKRKNKRRYFKNKKNTLVSVTKVVESKLKNPNTNGNIDTSVRDIAAVGSEPVQNLTFGGHSLFPMIWTSTSTQQNSTTSVTPSSSPENENKPKTFDQYLCPFCDKCFSNRQSRSRHVHTKHAEGLSGTCSECGHVYTNLMTRCVHTKVTSLKVQVEIPE